METRIFDRVIFDVGDIVIRKYKEDAKQEEVVKSIMVENLDGFSYSVLFFKSNPDTFAVGYEYEPYDKADRKVYYDAWDKPRAKAKPIKKDTTIRDANKSRTRNRVLKMKL